jgi:farnesyl-diphosphate farnesyltransferase
VGEADEAVLLEQFPKCTRVFQSLPANSQVVIADITRRMGEGMASYVSKDMGQGTVTIGDYDLYCHYVAGLVGEELSRLFSCTGYESAAVEEVSTTLANTMGLFLQKTNIIRDYLEDFVDGRAFWPKEVWGHYAPTGNLGDLAEPKNRDRAVACLNHLITNALECVPECLDYLAMLDTREVFRFCAIPQVMAIATLSELYNNSKVFTGVVKIRKGMASELILDTGSAVGVHKWFNFFAKSIIKRIPNNDPNAEATLAICEKIIEITQTNAIIARQHSLLNTTTQMVMALPLWYGLRRLNQPPIVTMIALFVGYPLTIFIAQLLKGRGVWKWLRFGKK